MKTDVHYGSLNLMKEGDRVILAKIKKAPLLTQTPIVINSDMVYSEFVDTFAEQIEELACEIVKTNKNATALFEIVFALHKNDRVAVETRLDKRIIKTKQIENLEGMLSMNMEMQLRTDFDELARRIDVFNEFTNKTMEVSMEVKYPVEKALVELAIHFGDVIEAWGTMERQNPLFNLTKQYHETISAVLIYANPDANILEEELQEKLVEATSKILLEYTHLTGRFEHVEPFGTRRSEILTDYLLQEMWMEHGIVPNEEKRDNACQIMPLMITFIELHRSLNLIIKSFKKMYQKTDIREPFMIPHTIAFLWSMGLDLQNHKFQEAGEYLFNSEQSQEIVRMSLEPLIEEYGEDLPATVLTLAVCNMLEKTVREGLYK